MLAHSAVTQIAFFNYSPCVGCSVKTNPSQNLVQSETGAVYSRPLQEQGFPGLAG